LSVGGDRSLPALHPAGEGSDDLPQQLWVFQHRRRGRQRIQQPYGGSGDRANPDATRSIPEVDPDSSSSPPATSVAEVPALSSVFDPDPVLDPEPGIVERVYAELRELIETRKRREPVRRSRGVRASGGSPEETGIPCRDRPTVYVE
jgi:hypothetical protein